MELVKSLEELLDEEDHPRIRMAEAMVRALRDELESLLRRRGEAA
jgi:hypothetical protein